MKKLILASAIVSAFVFELSACSKEEVSFQTLETERGTARDNSMWNAQFYRQSNVLLNGWDIIGRGDSSQTANCPMGDGWATMDFVSPDKKQVVKAKCSTVSANVGCLADTDFKTKPYANEDGHCQKGKLPSTLPKIGK